MPATALAAPLASSALATALVVIVATLRLAAEGEGDDRAGTTSAVRSGGVEPETLTRRRPTSGEDSSSLSPLT